MSAVLVIDDRERDLIARLRELSVAFVVRHLELADVLVEWDGSVLVALERKTASDLASSLVDGRLLEQKQRLLALRKQLPETTVGYLLEGRFDDPCRRYKIPPATLMVNYAMMSARDRLVAYRTTDMTETCALLVALRKKAPYGQTCTQPQPPPQSKQQRMGTESAVYSRMLQCVPGCSAAVAEIVMAECPGMKSLRNCLSSPGKRARLSKLKRAGGKRRALGKTVVDSIARALAAKEHNKV
jgi:ERCC4-type nuclease